MHDTGKVPRDNHAYWLGAGGALATDINLRDFVDDDFTVAVWFQPEYQYGGSGALLGESKSGRLHIGQGDYRFGRYDRDKGDPKAPMFAVGFGTQTAVYELPEAANNAWVHATVVRRGNRLTLYINGSERRPYRKDSTVPATLDIVPNDGQQPRGTVKIGRRRSGKQFHGFVDDVGIFKMALSPTAVATLARTKRLSGKEQGLWRGIGFDKPTNASGALPQRLKTELKPNVRARQYKVSRTRHRSDRAVWGNPFHLAAAYPVVRQLPFGKNEVWRVSQGVNDPGPSHNGGTAFASVDFQPMASCAGAKVTASMSGDIVAYRRNDNPATGNTSNVIQMRWSKSLGITMMHFEHETLHPSIKGGTTHPRYPTWNTLEPGPGISYRQGEYIGTVGTNGCHVHVDAFVTPAGEHVVYPFAEFEVSEDKGKTWRYIFRGIPRTGMYVRRTKDAPVTPRPREVAATKPTKPTKLGPIR